MELLVLMAIVALTGASALPTMNSGKMNAALSAETLLGDIRMARANATTRGAHFRITLGGSSYSVERLQDDDNDGEWLPDANFTKRTVDFHSSLSLTVDQGDGIIEFTTRGLIAAMADGTPPEIEEISLHDSKYGTTRNVQV